MVSRREAQDPATKSVSCLRMFGALDTAGVWIAWPNVRANADWHGRQRWAGRRQCAEYLRPAQRCLPWQVGG
jgi:hypothetical protein